VPPALEQRNRNFDNLNPGVSPYFVLLATLNLVS
jgi:hypothetical protein